MMDAIKIFLFGVDVFFILYLIGYSSFLLLSVLWGSSRLYQKRRDEELEAKAPDAGKRNKIPFRLPLRTD